MDCDDEERSQKMVEDQILRALATKRVSERGEDSGREGNGGVQIRRAREGEGESKRERRERER